MGMSSIIRALAIGIFTVGLAMLIPYIFSFSSEGGRQDAYLFGAALTITISAGLLMATSPKWRPTDFRGGILMVLSWWVFIPLFAALPLYTPGSSFFDAYFEAVSALTTTGAWLSKSNLYQDETGLLWRAILQWIGGLVSISAAASIIVRPALFGIETIQPPFARGDGGSYLRSFGNALRTFAPAFFALTMLCFLLLVIAGVATFDALILSASTMSSGGLVPRAEGLVSYHAGVSAILSPFMLFSGMNFILISFAMKGAWRSAQDNESEVYITMIISIGLIYWMFTGEGDLSLIFTQLFNAVSLFSTNGITIGQGPPLTFAIITALIGGAAVSSAGGFKILRWMVIMGRAREEIRTLISPNMVHGSSRIADELGVWMHFIVFTLFLGILVLILTFSGHSFEVATTAATGAVSNTGPLLGLVEGQPGYYGNIEGLGRVAIVVAMILGRIEAVAALALFNRAFWRS